MMIYTIQATDDTLGKEQLKKIYQKDDIQVDMMNIAEFDCQNIEFAQIKEYCFTSPFFASHKVAILKNPVFLTAESSKKDYSNFIEGLISYIENQNNTTILIIYSLYDKLDERKKIVKYLKLNTKFISINSPNAMELTKIIKDMVQKRNGSIDDAACALLVEKVGTNLIDIKSEVEKLTLFKDLDNITKQDIEDFVSCSIDASIFDLSNAILENNISRSITLFEDLTKSGLEPIALISILANQLRIALLAKTYRRLNLDGNAIAKKLKIHPYRIKIALGLSFSDKNIKGVLIKLAELDYQIKIGKINKYHGMKLLILSI